MTSEFGVVPVIYFWREDTKNVMEMVMQRYTPAQLFEPLLDEVLKPVGLAGSKAKWSQYAGCTCPCSRTHVN